MLFFLAFLCSVSVWGRPQTQSTYGQAELQPQSREASAVTPIPIVSQSESVGADGAFNFSFESGNGINVQQGGFIKKVQFRSRSSANLNGNPSSDDSEGNVQVISGGFSYTAPDGTPISLKYVADENGFQPVGPHLPTPPPIPPEIQRALSLLSNKTDYQRSINEDHYEQPNPPPIEESITSPSVIDEEKLIPEKSFAII